MGEFDGGVTLMWSYPQEFLQSLSGLGLAPTSQTPPARVREALNDLYRYELRRLRDRLRAGDVEKSQYFDRVVTLRKKYWLLSFQVPAWETICASPAAPDPSGDRS